VNWLGESKSKSEVTRYISVMVLAPMNQGV